MLRVRLALGHWCSKLLVGAILLAGAGTSSTAGCGVAVDTTNPPPNQPPGPPPPAPGFFTPPPDGPHADFPKEPVIAGAAPQNVGALFQGVQAAPSGGPCFMEPEVGSMLPKNWLRPRFRWIPTGSLGGGDAGAQNVFELRL